MSCLILAVAASCTGPTVEIRDRPVAETRTTKALTNPLALDRRNRSVLRDEQLLALYRSDPSRAIRILAGRYREDPTPARRLALAEVSSDQADRFTEDRPKVALGLYLDAASLAEAGAIAAIGSNGEAEERAIYNYAAARVVRILREYSRGGRRSIQAPGNLHRWRLTLAGGRGLVDPRSYDKLVPASWLKIKGIHWERSHQRGLGAAMVGHHDATPELRAADPMMPDTGRATPLNASFRFAGNGASIHLQDLMTRSTARVRGRTVPLEGDFSSTLAYVYHGDFEASRKLRAMLRPASFEDTIRLYSFEAFRDDKTPLILVHGLMATAEDWLPFVNALLGDAVVREHYQILVFNYPTGNAITRNAADLRDALAALRRRHPDARDMVILGHSMGGVISNMQIRDSGDRIWTSAFTTDIEELGLERETEAEIRRLVFYKANPDINRAIFLAAPFRGSDFASNRIGQLGAWLIRFPFDTLDAVVHPDHLDDVLTESGQVWRNRPFNSVTSLRPDNPTLNDVLASPPRRGVSIHTIIARTKPEQPLAESSDGVVPYTSARLAEADTELVVDGRNHSSMILAPETLEEVYRILYRHAGVRRGKETPPAAR